MYAKVLQPTVMRIAQNVNALGKLKEKGYNVCELKGKPPREFRSFTYNQSVFELNKKSGQPVLSLSKFADIPLRMHRKISDAAAIKEVTLKNEPTGERRATAAAGNHYR